MEEMPVGISNTNEKFIMNALVTSKCCWRLRRLSIQNISEADQKILEEQNDYAEQVRSLLPLRAFNHPPLAHVHTYGCQQNVSDGERICGMLARMGYEFTDRPELADLILYNTCAVREHAQDRVFGNVGALKKLKARRPSLIIALCGCMVQQPEEAARIQKSYPYVGLVFGTHVIHKLPELLYRNMTESRRVFELPQEDGKIIEGVPVRRDGEFKAWLPIMYGCDNFCSYCIVPYVRGRERSRSVDAVIAEATELAALGYKEITLLGQNVNSYGKGQKDGVNFAGLLRRLNDIPGDFKIRFMTSHPKDATRELIETVARCEKVAKHIHLPFQSGNNRILKEMNRGYTREKYMELIAYIKEQKAGISVTSDVIVGFPGETLAEFEDTLDLIEQVGFTSLFTFIYSARNGTPAATLPDPVSREEKAVWLNRLIKFQGELAARRAVGLMGKTFTVLCEGSGRDGKLSGRTQSNVVIEFPAPESTIGQYVQVKITNARTWLLDGELV